MKKRGVILLFFALGVVFTAAAQKKAIISFVATEHDFGTFKEEAGNQSHRYEFTNKGDDTLRVYTVRATNGSTMVDWTKSPIAPGGRGYVQLTFDPRNRPGMFNRLVEVNSNDPDRPKVTLSLKGNVTPRVRTLADDYPQQLGNLRLKNAQVTLSNVPTNAVVTDTLHIFNEWGREMTFGFTKLPPYISVKAVPEKLKPGKKGYLLVSYDGAKRNDFGYVYDRFTFETNDTLMPEKNVGVSANITEDFSSWTPEQMAKAPKIKFEKTTYDFGEITEGTNVEYDYILKNDGVNDLFIRKVKGG